MSITHTLDLTVVYNGSRYTLSDSNSAGEEHNVSETIPVSSTDLEVAWTADASAMSSFLMISDQDLTVETNSGTVPDDTFTLTANVPVFWSAGNGSTTNPITADVTTNIFVTNASATEEALLTIQSLQDPTP